MKKRSVLQLSMALTLGVAAAMPTWAQGSFPQRPITLIVPFAPGGSVDMVARVVAEKWSKSLGQPVVVDNKAGAATIVASDFLQKAPADGYTVMIGTSTTFVVNPIIYPKLPYNPATSFESVGIIGSSGLALLANAEIKPKTLPDLLADIKARPKAYSYGSHGSGSTVHFAAEMLWSAAKLDDVVHVPYKGSAPAITDLSGGQIPLAFDAIPAAATAAKGGRVRLIAVTSEKRSPLAPDVPTVAESGFPGFKMTSWFGVVGPKNLPAVVKDKLERDLAAAISDPDVVKRLQGVGFDVKWTPSTKYLEMIKADTTDLAPIAKKNNITAGN